jgi:hypothetical protein
MEAAAFIHGVTACAYAVEAARWPILRIVFVFLADLFSPRLLQVCAATRFYEQAGAAAIGDEKPGGTVKKHVKSPLISNAAANDPFRSCGKSKGPRT